VACMPASCHDATVTEDPLLERAQLLWADLSGVACRDSAICVAVSARSLLCPPGWVGIVSLGCAVIAIAPDDDTAEIVQRALGDLSSTAMTDPAVVSDRSPVTEILGPATLAYCDMAGFRPAGSSAVVATPLSLR
jgi:hypothetical protein